MPRYTLCPYYIDENKKTISCEDVCRSFDSTDEKWSWMDMYCDSWDWMRCPYAADRAEAYARYEEGEKMALEKQANEALRKEIDSLVKKLGRANKKVERQQKKIDELRAVNKSFVIRNEDLADKNKDLYRKWRQTDEKLNAQSDKIYKEIGALTDIYEQRMCYLIDKYAPDGVREEEIEAWAADKEFALVADFTDEGKAVAWKVAFKKDEVEKDGTHITERVPEDDRNQA